MKKIIFFFLFLTNTYLYSQTLINSYPFPNYLPYNNFWGIAVKNDSLWIGADYSATNYPYSKIYKITKTAVFVDSITTPYTFNHGLAWDGSGFWIAEYYRSSGARIYKMDIAGQRVDSILTGAYASGIGGIALDGNNIWFSVYYPDNTSYPFAYAYKMNLSTRQLVDTIPLRGKQVQGIAVKGDTILYVTDSFQGDFERIYAYRKAVGDTLFSFAAPDPDNACKPRGMVWDGQYLWLVADRVGGAAYAYRTLYKYGLAGGGTPIISPNSVNFDFGNTLIGNTSTQTLTITNIGTSNLIITGKNTNNPRFGIQQNTVPDTIQPTQSKNYTLTYSPLTYGNDSAILALSSNDPATPVKNIRMIGRGINTGSYVYFPVTNYDYGQRREWSTCGFIFPVTNRGNAPLLINSITLSTPRYRLDTMGVTFPVTIDTQKTKTFRIWYHPIASGTYSDTIKVNSNSVNLSVGKISITGSTSPVPNTIGAQLWQGIVPDNPMVLADDYKPISIKQINDVNGDGYNDMLVATNNYFTICYNGSSSVTADTLWAFNSYTSSNNGGGVTTEEAMQVRDDIDGDGIQDVVIGCGGGNECLYTISGRTGKVIWIFGDTTASNQGPIEGIRVDKDYNGDGIKDVIASVSGTGVAGAMGRRSVYCLNGLNGNLIFQNSQTDYEFLYDLANNQIGGAVSTAFNYGPYFVKGFNNIGSTVWTYNSADVIWHLRETRSIDSDTINDFLGFAGFNGKIFALNGSTGLEAWTRNLGLSVDGNMKILQDNNFGNNIYRAMVSGSQSLLVINPVTGTSYWTNGLDNSYVFGVCQVNYGNSYKPMIAAATYGNHVYFCDYTTGNILFQYSFGSGGPATAAEKISSLKSVRGTNANGFSDEVVAGSRDGRIICLSGGTFLTSGIRQIGNEIPGKYELGQNYPNPFNPVTKIKFDIPNGQWTTINVQLKIYDILGREVTTLVNEKLSPGTYNVEWNASDYASGIYFYQLKSGDFLQTKKLILLK